MRRARVQLPECWAGVDSYQRRRSSDGVRIRGERYTRCSHASRPDTDMKARHASLVTNTTQQRSSRGRAMPRRMMVAWLTRDGWRSANRRQIKHQLAQELTVLEVDWRHGIDCFLHAA